MKHKTIVTDQKIVRQLNKVAILESVRQRPEGVSRAEVARLTTLSRATVSAIVDELLSDGIVVESGTAKSRGGRRPTLLQLNSKAGWVIGIDIGATHLRVLVADSRGGVLAQSESEFDIAAGPEDGLDLVDKLMEGTVQKAGRSLEPVTAIAVSVPGPVVADAGMVVAPPIMPGWDGYPIRRRLQERWKRPVYIDNDAALGALGEWTFGGGQGVSNLAYIKIGTGIGCGILIDGKIYSGVVGTAGEIGHVTIREDGPPCRCGNYGCLEAMAGGRAIALRAQQAVGAGQRTMLADLGHGHEISARDVAEAARQGDAVSQQLLSDAGRHIGSALASLVNLLNPGLVLIGGGVVGAGRFLLDPIHEAVAARSMRASYEATRIELASLGDLSIVLGAAALALSHTFQNYVNSGHVRQAVQTH